MPNNNTESLSDIIKAMQQEKELSHRIDPNGMVWLAADEVYEAIRQHEAQQPSEDVVRNLEVLRNVVRFADGRCWPEVQAAIDANRSIIDV